ncbi:MAG TPA: hypothetical protein VF260_08985 [Bacilli bacterium]
MTTYQGSPAYPNKVSAVSPICPDKFPKYPPSAATDIVRRGFRDKPYTGHPGNPASARRRTGENTAASPVGAKDNPALRHMEKQAEKGQTAEQADRNIPAEIASFACLAQLPVEVFRQLAAHCRCR